MWHADIGFKVICTLWLNGKWESEGVLPSKSLSREEDTGVRGSGSGSPPSATSSTESFFSSRKLSFSVTKPRERKVNSSSALLRWKLGWLHCPWECQKVMKEFEFEGSIFISFSLFFSFYFASTAPTFGEDSCGMFLRKNIPVFCPRNFSQLGDYYFCCESFTTFREAVQKIVVFLLFAATS